jgi:Aspartyl protease
MLGIMAMSASSCAWRLRGAMSLALCSLSWMCSGVSSLVIAEDMVGPPLAPIASRPDGFQRVGRIIALVKINGKGPFHFMLDTGSSRTVLGAPLLQRLGLALRGDAPVSVWGVSGATLAPTVHVDRLDCGALHVRDLRLPVLAGPLLEGIDGILGMDGFEGKRLSADFVRGRLSITQGNDARWRLPFPAARVHLSAPRELSPPWLMLDVYVGRVYTRAIIDTGGTHTLGNMALLRSLESEFGAALPQVDTEVMDATQVLRPSSIVRVPRLHLPGAVIDYLDVTFADYHVFEVWGLQSEPALLIGMDVLGSLSELTIDYRAHELQLLPRPYMRAASF